MTADYVGECDYFPTKWYPTTDFEIVLKKRLFENPGARWFECIYMQKSFATVSFHTFNVFIY